VYRHVQRWFPVTVAIAFLLSACAGSPDSGSGTSPGMGYGSGYQGVRTISRAEAGLARMSTADHLARVRTIIEKRNLEAGETVAVRLLGKRIESGALQQPEWDSDTGITILRQTETGGKAYFSYGWSMVVDVLPLSEADSFDRIFAAEQLLDTALDTGDVAKLKAALDDGASLPVDENGMSNLLLRVVRQADRAEMIRFLVSKGANPGALASFGNNIVHEALNAGQGTNAIALVQAGADHNSKDVRNRTTLMAAYYYLDAAEPERAAALQAYIDFLVREKGADPAERFRDPMYLADNFLGMNGLRLIKLDEKECFDLLDKHNVKYTRLDKVGDVSYPVRITSPIDGVRYKHTGSSKKFSVMDCRLVAALIGMSPVFKKYNIATVYHMRAHAAGARIGGRGNTSGHHYALALDIARMVTRDGKQYEVLRDWKDHRPRAEVCASPENESGKQRYLRNFICDTAKEDLFHWILTPHYNRAHHDHFHVEIRANTDYLLFN